MRAPQLLYAVLVLIAPLHTFAQKPTGDRVAGSVVNALDDHPLAHATITLTDILTRRPELTATANAEGRFNFENVAPGKYRMTGDATGYVSANYLAHEQLGTAIVTGAGLDTTALVLRLTPQSSISGRIIDEAGDPVEHASVTLYRENPTSPTGRIRRYRAASTTDTGEYEFTRLPPGKYFISAMGIPWYAVHSRTYDSEANFPYRQTIDPAVDVAYPLIFFPHALDSDAATPIILRGGEQLTANMQLQPEHAVTLSVRTPANESSNQRNVQLMRTVFGVDEPVPIQMMENNNGVQSFPGLAPGQYKVREIAPGSRFSASAQSVDLTTGSASLDSSAPINLATISVTVHAANGETLPPHLQLNLRSVEDARGVSGTPLGDNGSAEIANVPPGEYRFGLNGSGHPWNVLSLALAGQQTPDKRLKLTTGGSLAVDLTISAQTVSVQGFARRDNKAAPGSLVILVPAGADTSEALFRRDQTDLDGSFAFNNVVPGNYILVAIDDAWSLRWTDPIALMPYLLHGLPVTITANGSATFHIPDPVSTQPRVLTMNPLLLPGV